MALTITHGLMLILHERHHFPRKLGLIPRVSPQTSILGKLIVKYLKLSSILIASVWCIVCVVGMSNVGSDFGYFFVLLCLSILWVSVSVIMFIVLVYRKASGNDGVSAYRTFAWEVAAIAIVGVCSYFGIFTQARFFISVPFLQNYVDRVINGTIPPSEVPTARLVGFYWVTEAHLLPDKSVRLITSAHHLFDTAGFAYSVNSPPIKIGEDSYEHLHGPWWLYYQSW